MLRLGYMLRVGYMLTRLFLSEAKNQVFFTSLKFQRQSTYHIHTNIFITVLFRLYLWNAWLSFVACVLFLDECIADIQ